MFPISANLIILYKNNTESMSAPNPSWHEPKQKIKCLFIICFFIF